VAEQIRACAGGNRDELVALIRSLVAHTWAGRNAEPSLDIRPADECRHL
jgi:hypothetical protein